jgi:hypothetical protein
MNKISLILILAASFACAASAGAAIGAVLPVPESGGTFALLALALVALAALRCKLAK